MALQPQTVTGVDVAFGGRTRELLPAMADIPAEFKTWNNRWQGVAAHWFYKGLKGATFKPKPGIDQNKALSHVAACMASWEPKHEHKMAGCAYLLSEFFEDVVLPSA